MLLDELPLLREPTLASPNHKGTDSLLQKPLRPPCGPLSKLLSCLTSVVNPAARVD